MENINQIPNIQPVQSISTPQPVQNNNIFKIPFIISIFIILGLIIVLYFNLNSKINQLSNNQTADITSIPTAIPTMEEEVISPTSTVDNMVKEITTLLNPTNRPNFSVSISKTIGNYSTGLAGYINDSGYGWTAAKINGIWKIVHKGQDGMTCNIVNQYQIPKEIYGNCYEY